MLLDVFPLKMQTQGTVQVEGFCQNSLFNPRLIDEIRLNPARLSSDMSQFMHQQLSFSSIVAPAVT